MNYVINSILQEGVILTTNTTITLDSGDVLTLDISHYMPQSSADIELGITNRAISEQARINSLNNIPSIIDSLPINQNITI